MDLNAATIAHTLTVIAVIWALTAAVALTWNGWDRWRNRVWERRHR